LITVFDRFPINLIEQITDDEVGRVADIDKTLDYVYRQLGQLRIIKNLPKSEVPSEALVNSALDVKSAVVMYIAVHLSHQCNRLGIGGYFQLNKHRSDDSRKDCQHSLSGR
jgi:hypothetical protein